MAFNSVLLLWPLFVSHYFAWTDAAYSRLLLAHGLVSALALTLCPALENALGPERARLLAGVASSVASALCFAVQGTDRAAQGVHVGLTLVLVAATAFLTPSLQAAASLCLREGHHGRAFGTIAALASLGAIAASLAGAQLFEYSLRDPEGLGGGGALPLYLVSALSGLATLLLAVAPRLLTRPRFR
mmetsp:Transcript_41648/g.98738  ORF Transcript_41648/g.98738 Transcript_41648/m.98738 type:complete len:187 (-) Transcript_41648:56-616(-)